MGVIVTLAIKDLRLLVRDRMALFWSLVFPLVFALFFGTLFGGDPDERGQLQVAVIDEADSPGSRALLERLQASEAMEVEVVEDLDAASDSVRRGKRVAYVRIKEGLEDGGFALFSRGPDDESLIELGVDPTRSAERGMLEGLVNQALFSGMSEGFSDPAAMQAQVLGAREQIAGAPDLDAEQKRILSDLMGALDRFASASQQSPSMSADFTLGDGLIATTEVGQDEAGDPRSSFDVTFPSAMVWALMGLATTFATSLVRERAAGTLLRLQVAPVSRAQLLASKGLACALAGIANATLLLTIGVVALGVHVGNPLHLLLAMAAGAVCFTGVMMVMSIAGKTEAAVAGGSWVLMMPLAMIGGGMIPLIAMPKWMLTASNVSPFKWAILAIEGAVWRDFSLAELALPLGVLVGLGIALFGLGYAVFARR